MHSVLVETVSPLPNPTNLLIMEPLGASGAGADKKRNKLGYHRTSVACVHCRRRKIRCLVAADDSQGRCENCIRLRKECQFYPVDQQPQPDRKSSRPGGITLETPSSSADPSIASSSPPPLGGAMDPTDIYQYQQLSLHSTATTPEMTASGFHPSAGFSSVASMGGFATGPTSPVDGVAHPELVPGQTIDPNATYNMGHASPVMWTQGQMLTALPPGVAPHPQHISTGIPSHPQMLSPAAAAPYTVRPDGSIWPTPPPRAITTIPSQPEMYHPHPHHHTIFASSPVPQPELKRSMTSPAPGRSHHQPSPLHSPPSTQIQINYSGQPIPYQHHHPPPPPPAGGGQSQPYPPQWNPGMNAIPMGDGTYTTLYATPEHFQMSGQQHPPTGP
ncbi:C6 finger domain protein, putative [Talaromyces stipitatus ATCC 10500]|uniref:C6 finger domain protein, putative n=1 Tax=Talaromyces stipitatus (strain ATCC 10500 / CBS 375.48 / QM 6759 / NRRL 1006) TaxID=441959 RepID=B8MKI8_TALSN|nr:C6 finger domain protein, putative [Talaromyces stipitatus ATCC 10500]EED15343.1 C6 finger domain protein, putative [Talaromyces stipitatus ATCC 10500]